LIDRGSRGNPFIDSMAPDLRPLLAMHSLQSPHKNNAVDKNLRPSQIGTVIQFY
jgi:hypothetical protein